jgi:hypothetical protein
MGAVSDQPRTLCESCREPINPDAPGVVRAVEQKDLTGFGQARDMGDGMGVLFHEDCFPDGDPRYRRAD